jgi:ribonuclease HII
MTKKHGAQILLGIDEVGRGPLAGPVSVGVALVPIDFDWSRLPGVTDSKKLTPQAREVIYRASCRLRREGKIDFSVASVSAKTIDRIGIVSAITQALRKSLNVVMERQGLVPGEVQVKLDGGLKAPNEYLFQETIIKGDAREKVIGLASVVAKVVRDTYMCRISSTSQFNSYGFDKNKGYGTKLHRQAIAKHGLTREHRRSFCHEVAQKSVL